MVASAGTVFAVSTARRQGAHLVLVLAWLAFTFVLAALGTSGGMHLAALVLMVGGAAYVLSFVWPMAFVAAAAAGAVLIPWYWGPRLPGGTLTLQPSLVLSLALIVRFGDRISKLKLGWTDAVVILYVTAVAMASVSLFGRPASTAFTTVLTGPLSAVVAFRLVALGGRRDRDVLLTSLLLAVAVAGGLAVIERSTGWNPFIGYGQRFLATPRAGLLERFGGVRAEGPFGQPVAASLVLAAGFVGAASMYIRTRRTWWIAVCLLCGAGAISTQSRTGVGALLFGAVLLALHAARAERARGLLAVLAVAIALGIALGGDQFGDFRASLVGSSREAATVTHRRELNAVLLDSSYFTLVGPGRVRGAATVSQVSRARSPVRDPASEWVRTYLVFGAIPTSLLAALIIGCAVAAAATRESARHPVLLMMVTIGVGLFGVTLNGQLFALFWGLVGLSSPALPEDSGMSA